MKRTSLLHDPLRLAAVALPALLLNVSQAQETPPSDPAPVNPAPTVTSPIPDDPDPAEAAAPAPAVLTENERADAEAAPRTLVAELSPSAESEVDGQVSFEALDGDQVRVNVHLTGLQADTEYLLRLEDRGAATSPEGENFRDLGSFQADAEGTATRVMTVRDLALHEGENALEGRTLKVRAAGDAGMELAHGTISEPDDSRPVATTIPAPESVNAEDPAITTLSPQPVEPLVDPAEKTTEVTRTEAGTPAPANRAPATPRTQNNTGKRAVDELEDVAEEIGRGAEKAARTTGKVLERGVEGAGKVIKKVGKKVEKAIE